MNLKTSHLTKSLHEKFSHSVHRKRLTPLTLNSDWKKLITGWFIIFIIIILANIVIFLRVRKGEDVTGETASSTLQIERFDRPDLTRWSNEMIDRQSNSLLISIEKDEIEEDAATSSEEVEE